MTTGPEEGALAPVRAWSWGHDRRILAGLKVLANHRTGCYPISIGAVIANLVCLETTGLLPDFSLFSHSYTSTSHAKV